MARTKGSLNKKNKSIESEIKPEGQMTETQTLETLETEVDKVRVELESAKRELEEKRTEIKRMKVREVDDEEMVIIKKDVAAHSKDAGIRAKIEAQKAYDNVMVTGKFINRRAPGNSVKLTYLKYADDPVKWYVFEDGKVYTIQRGFADQINDHYYKPGFIQKSPDAFMDPNKPSSAISEVDTSNKIYSFVPVNF